MTNHKMTVTKYEGDKIIETWSQSNINATMEHWDGWRRLDNSLGATAKIYCKVVGGVMKPYKYVTRLDNKKVVYLIEEEQE